MKPMYGVTHTPDGQPIVVEPKAIKVGIGLPKGKAIHAFINSQKQWCVKIAKEVHRFDTRREAMLFYRQQKPGAPDRQYPAKVNHFVLNRIGADGSFEPDWDAIEDHGPVPTEITIVFTSDDPFQASFQYWTATERRCQGDGLSASRILSMASTDAERRLAEEASRRGERTFPITNGCWLRGCPFSRSTVREGKEYPAPCRPHGRLLFQLVESLRLGGTAYFDTTGLRSISQLFSCIQIFRTLSGYGDPARGHVAGIPLQLVLRPYRTSHNGRPSTQYGVSLEFRGENVMQMKQKLIQTGLQYHQIGGGTGTPAEEPPEVGAAIDAEFSALPNLPPAEAPEGPEQESGIELEAETGSYPGPVDPDDPWADFGEETRGTGVDEVPSKEEKPSPPTPAASAPAELSPSAEQPVNAAAQPAPASKPNPKWQKLYNFCRSKGMNDRMIYDELGRRGYESPGEIPDSVYPELMKWAQSYKPSQTSLL